MQQQHPAVAALSAQPQLLSPLFSVSEQLLSEEKITDNFK
jgi:hypothetical protein